MNIASNKISLSWVSYLHNQLTLQGCQSPHYLHFHPRSCYFTFACILVCIWKGGGGFAYPGRTPLILCSVGPSGQGVWMTHSFLVTERVPILDKSWMGGHQLFTCQSKQCKEILLQASEPDCTVQVFSGHLPVNAAPRPASKNYLASQLFAKMLQAFDRTTCPVVKKGVGID